VDEKVKWLGRLKNRTIQKCNKWSASALEKTRHLQLWDTISWKWQRFRISAAVTQLHLWHLPDFLWIDYAQKAIGNVLRLQLFDMNVLDQRKCLHSENIHTKIGKNVHSTKGEHIKNKCNVNHNSASLSPLFTFDFRYFGCCSWERSLYWAAQIENASVFTGDKKIFSERPPKFDKSMQKWFNQWLIISTEGK